MSDPSVVIPPDEEAASHASELQYAKDVRHRVVDALIDTAVSSKDPETLNLVLKAVDGIDKAALKQMQIAQRDRESKSRENEAEVLSRALIELANRRAGQPQPEPQHDRGPRTHLDPEAKPEFNKDLKDQTPSGENYGDFKSRMES